MKPAAPTELIYQTASAELKLAKSGQPYLVFDIPRRALEVRLKGTVVFRTPLEVVEAPAASLDRFIEKFISGEGLLARPIAGKYLFEAQQQTPDSILKIVSEVINVKPELMQREIPSRFRVFWDDKLVLDVLSDVEVKASAKPLEEKLQNTMMEARYVLRRPFGATLLALRVTGEEAMTLYRVAKPGLPTLVKLVDTDLPPPPKKEKGKQAKGR